MVQLYTACVTKWARVAGTVRMLVQFAYAVVSQSGRVAVAGHEGTQEPNPN